MTNEEAINLISRNKSVFQYDTEMTKALDLAIKALEERPQGEWNVFEYCGETCYMHKCSNEVFKANYHFCPNCGADMRKGGAGGSANGR